IILCIVILHDYLKSDLRNRFIAVVPFNELAKEDLVKIVDLMLMDIVETVEERDMTIDITEEAKEKLVELGYDPRFGARPLRRVIQDKIENQLTDLILEHDDVKAVQVIVDDEAIAVTLAE